MDCYEEKIRQAIDAWSEECGRMIDRAQAMLEAGRDRKKNVVVKKDNPIRAMTFHCPACDKQVFFGISRCPDCGQMLDWYHSLDEEEEE